MAQLKVKRGTSSNLNSVSVVDGQLIITTDTKEIYLDNNSSRIKLAAPPRYFCKWQNWCCKSQLQ